MAEDNGQERDATIEVRPRIYMNGFPKSGLHLGVLMARTMEREAATDPPWCGSFGWNAWSTEWRPLSVVMVGLRHIRDGTWLKGHCGYRAEFEQYLYWHGVAMAFIYRDLRDVLVSQSYHVVAEDDSKFYHTGKDIYRQMGHEERLLACLNGIAQYSGLFERWEQYAPWLNVPWVLKLRYEDMIGDKLGTARAFVDYVYKRTAWGVLEPELPDAEFLERVAVGMAHNMTRNDLSPTYRKGTSGQWREEFTPRVVDAFKEKAGDWLVRLGYEEDDAWEL